MAERISIEDSTYIQGYANHIQRYEFAAKYCSGRRVLDAGCGTGYGSSYLATGGAAAVVAVDISEVALAEASRLYLRDNLRFVRGDVERLDELPDLGAPFDVVVNLENIEHLEHPESFLECARRVLASDGLLVVSSPNGLLTERGEDGRIKNQYHVREYDEEEFRRLLATAFPTVEMFGQWKTPEGISRYNYERRVFENLGELYYSPSSRAWRLARRLLGRPCVAPPCFTAAGTSFPWEYAIRPLQTPPYPWPPEVLLAVCRP